MYYFLENKYLKMYNRFYHFINDDNSFEIYKIFVLFIF